LGLLRAGSPKRESPKRSSPKRGSPTRGSPTRSSRKPSPKHSSRKPNPKHSSRKPKRSSSSSSSRSSSRSLHSAKLKRSSPKFSDQPRHTRRDRRRAEKQANAAEQVEVTDLPSGLFDRAMRVRLAQSGQEVLQAASGGAQLTKQHGVSAIAQAAPGVAGTGAALSLSRGVSRAQAAKFHRQGYMSVDSTVPGHQSPPAVDVFLNAMGPLLRHTITIQFAAVCPVRDGVNRLPVSALHCSFKLFDCPASQTPSLSAAGAAWAELEALDALEARFVAADAHGAAVGPRSLNAKLRRKAGPSSLSGNAPLALHVSESAGPGQAADVDELPTCQVVVDTSATHRALMVAVPTAAPAAAGGHDDDRDDDIGPGRRPSNTTAASKRKQHVTEKALQFARYLRDESLEIEIWDDRSMICVGVAFLPLRRFLRHGQQSVSFAEEVTIFAPDRSLDLQTVAAVSESGVCTPTGTGTVLGTLHILGRNHGQLGQHDVDTMGITALLGANSSQPLRRDLHGLGLDSTTSVAAVAPTLRIRAARVTAADAPRDTSRAQRAGAEQAGAARPLPPDQFIAADISVLTREEFAAVLRAFDMHHDGRVSSALFLDFAEGRGVATANSLLAKFSALQWLAQHAEQLEEHLATLATNSSSSSSSSSSAPASAGSNQDGRRVTQLTMGREEFFDVVQLVLSGGKPTISLEEVRVCVCLRKDVV
jgi:hypothetical protein